MTRFWKFRSIHSRTFPQRTFGDVCVILYRGQHSKTPYTIWCRHPSPVNSPYKGQWRGVLIFSLNCAWTNGWVNNRDASDLKRPGTHYDVTVMRSKHNCGQKSLSFSFHNFWNPVVYLINALFICDFCCRLFRWKAVLLRRCIIQN